VRNRKAYLKAGYVYIPQQDIVITVLNDFRTQLSKALAVSGQPTLQRRG
jgi:DNA primase large subunit